MLRIVVPETEMFDDSTQEFFTLPPVEVHLEHSLFSISKWEAKWNKAFLKRDEKTTEEVLDYIRCMTLEEGVDESVYRRLSNQNLAEINAYLEQPMTATYISDIPGQGPSRSVVTSEVIYYWMIALNIPFECEHWHINRLIMLVRVCMTMSQTGKRKMSVSEIMRRNSELNRARRAQLHTTG